MINTSTKTFLITVAMTIVALLITCSASTANAQSTNSLGFAAGGTYGLGLSYSHDTPTWGVQLTALPFWDSEEGGQVFGGINIKRNFHENGKVGLYGSFGVAGGFWRENEFECDFIEATQTDNCREFVDEGWGIVSGPGIGMQVLFWDNMLFRFELPVAVRYSSDGTYGLSPIPNTALMYRW